VEVVHGGHGHVAASDDIVAAGRSGLVDTFKGCDL
jgi:hypothetical protein